MPRGARCPSISALAPVMRATLRPFVPVFGMLLRVRWVLCNREAEVPPVSLLSKQLQQDYLCRGAWCARFTLSTTMPAIRGLTEFQLSI